MMQNQDTATPKIVYHRKKASKKRVYHYQTILPEQIYITINPHNDLIFNYEKEKHRRPS